MKSGENPFTVREARKAFRKFMEVLSMILLLGETAAAREISSRFNEQGLEFYRVETHEQQAYLLKPTGEFIKTGKFADISQWIESYGCLMAVDASHPSCSASLVELRKQCEVRGIPYLRLERPETKVPSSPLIHQVADWEEAISCLRERVYAKYEQGSQNVTVFVTTGSHQLETLVRKPFSTKVRFVVRVLPETRLVQKCQDLGIPARDIVAMQGPFSKELNRILYKFYGADILLTRDSGPAGGTDTKISAALALGLEIVLMQRARSTGGLIVHSVPALFAWVERYIARSLPETAAGKGV